MEEAGDPSGTSSAAGSAHGHSTRESVVVGAHAGSFLTVPLFTVVKETRSSAETEDGKRHQGFDRRGRGADSHPEERESSRGRE